MATQMSDAAVQSATGRSWGQWKQLLDDNGAKTLAHKDIASYLSTIGVPPWWSQMVTVEYERMIGRRAVGQRCDGAFSASASKTFAGDKDAAMARWCELVADMAEFNDVACDGEPRVTSSGNWRYWKVDLEDGSRVGIAIYDKAAGKASLGVNHEKIADAETAEGWKSYWKGLLAQL